MVLESKRRELYVKASLSGSNGDEIKGVVGTLNSRTTVDCQSTMGRLGTVAIIGITASSTYNTAEKHTLNITVGSNSHSVVELFTSGLIALQAPLSL